MRHYGMRPAEALDTRMDEAQFLVGEANQAQDDQLGAMLMAFHAPNDVLKALKQARDMKANGGKASKPDFAQALARLARMRSGPDVSPEENEKTARQIELLARAAELMANREGAAGGGPN